MTQETTDPSVRIANKRIELVDIDSIHPHPRNPREGDVGAVVESFRSHGFFGTLVCQASTRTILVGNHRWKAAKAIGSIPKVPVAWVDCDDEEALRILLVDNRTSDLASYDNPALADLLKELLPTEMSLDGTGYDLDALDDLNRLLGDMPTGPSPDGGAEASRADELRDKYGTAVGQVWHAGRHQIICGDTTDADTLNRLMEAPAACLWTDPPYGVNYEGKTKDALQIENDQADDPKRILDASLPLIADHLIPGAPFYIAAPTGRLGVEYAQCLAKAGWRYHQQLIWVKNSLVLGHSDYHHQHEQILYGWTPGKGRSGRGKHQASHWYGGNDATSVFHVDRPSRSEDHPTMKPVDLIRPMLINSTRGGAVVLDPFAGSGSTVVAAEMLDRECRAVELDPRYVAVTLERLVGLGLDPQLED